MGTSAASELLNFFIIAIYDLEPTILFTSFFMAGPLEMVTLTTPRIY